MTPTECTPSDTIDALKSPGMSAPGAPAAQDGVTTPIPLWHITSPNLITQFVSTPNMTITNLALPGHIFQGTVTTQVTPFGNGGSLIAAEGKGVPNESMWRGILNSVVGTTLFGIRNQIVADGCDTSNLNPIYFN
jgi:hypothetical protein